MIGSYIQSGEYDRVCQILFISFIFTDLSDIDTCKSLLGYFNLYSLFPSANTTLVHTTYEVNDSEDIFGGYFNGNILAYNLFNYTISINTYLKIILCNNKFVNFRANNLLLSI